MELDESTWELFEDTNKTVEAAANKALQQLGWNIPIKTRIALRRGAAAAPADCADVWCVELLDVQREIRHCRATYNSDDDMVQKFAKSFAALRRP